MGPTSIIPGSNLLGVNREGFFHSEDRIRAELAAPQSLEEWTGAMREHPERDVGTAAADAERERSAVQALRSPGLVERKLCVKAGTIVFMHHDLVHRASRAEPGAPFRAMIAIRNLVRISDPRPAPGAEEWAARGEMGPVHSAIWRYLRGLPLTAAGELEEGDGDFGLAAAVRIGESAAMGTAYRIAAAAAAGDARAADALVEAATTSADEAVRRAASYALTAAGTREPSGQLVLARLLDLLGRGVAGVAVPPCVYEHVDRAANVMAHVVHAVGQLANCMAPPTAAKAARLLSDLMARSTSEILAHVDGLPADVREANAEHLGSEYQSAVPISFFVLERRRILAEGSIAISQIGQRAAVRGETAVAMLALEALLAVITREEGCDPGADACPAYLRPQTAMHNAATSLVRLCSHPKTSRPDVPREHGVALPEGGNLRSLVEVALRRLGAVAEGGGGTAAHRAMVLGLQGLSWPWA